jgi:hypothetical protein
MPEALQTVEYYLAESYVVCVAEEGVAMLMTCEWKTWRRVESVNKP